MSDISKITLPNGNTYNLKDERISGIYPVIGTQTSTTGTWTGVINVDALYDGLTIAYYLPYTGSGLATLNLTLKDGITTTGAIPVYFTGTVRMETQYDAGSTIILTYWNSGSISVNGTETSQARWTAADSQGSMTGTTVIASSTQPSNMSVGDIWLVIES